MFKASITITLRASILDPQGKAMQRALHNLGHASVAQVRAGKHIEMLIDAVSAPVAVEVATKACRQLLANSVMEDFAVEVEELESAPAL